MNTRIAIATMAALAIGAATLPASAAGSHERTCEKLRDEHPGFAGAFNVKAHKATWNGAGYDDEINEYVCPGSGNGAPMSIEKVPSRSKHHKGE